MSPRLTSLDAAHLRLLDAVISGNPDLRPAVILDGRHLFSGQNSAPVGFTCAGAMPALRYAVGVVVGLRPKKQMGDLKAWPVVAMVTDRHPCRDRAVNSLPCEPMNLTAADLAIPIRMAIAGPYEAAIRLTARTQSQALKDGEPLLHPKSREDV